MAGSFFVANSIKHSCCDSIFLPLFPFFHSKHPFAIFLRISGINERSLFGTVKIFRNLLALLRFNTIL